MKLAIPTFQETFDRLVQTSIEREEIHQDLFQYSNRVGVNYDDVVAHIGREIQANQRLVTRFHELIRESRHTGAIHPDLPALCGALGEDINKVIASYGL